MRVSSWCSSVLWQCDNILSSAGQADLNWHVAFRLEHIWNPARVLGNITLITAMSREDSLAWSIPSSNKCLWSWFRTMIRTAVVFAHGYQGRTRGASPGAEDFSRQAFPPLDFAGFFVEQATCQVRSRSFFDWSTIVGCP